MILKRLSKKELLKYIQIKTLLLKQLMRLKRLTQLWLVYQIQIKDAFMIKLAVSKLLNNKSREVVIKHTVLLVTLLVLERQTLWAQKIYLITFSLVKKSLKDMVTNLSVADLNNNSDSKPDNHKNKKRASKWYSDSLVLCCWCYF